MSIFLGILAMLSPFWIIALLLFIVKYCDNKPYPKIKFKDFKKFYELNPKRWWCANDYVRCHVNGEEDCEIFVFKFIDECKYRIWRRKCDKHKVNQKHNQSTQRMLDAVKEDITKAKEKEAINTIDLFVKELDSIPSLLKTLEERGIHVNIKEG